MAFVLMNGIRLDEESSHLSVSAKRNRSVSPRHVIMV